MNKSPLSNAAQPVPKPSSLEIWFMDEGKPKQFVLNQPANKPAEFYVNGVLIKLTPVEQPKPGRSVHGVIEEFKEALVQCAPEDVDVAKAVVAELFSLPNPVKFNALATAATKYVESSLTLRQCGHLPVDPKLIQENVLDWKALRDALTFAKYPDWDGIVRIKDFQMDLFGGGGSWVHKPNNGVILTHTPTGIVERCNENKTVFNNKAIAMMRIMERIKAHTKFKGIEGIEGGAARGPY